MYRRTITGASLGALPLLALLLIAAPPPAAGLNSAPCGGPGDPVCKTTTTCGRAGPFERCVTNYDYYQKDAEEIQED